MPKTYHGIGYWWQREFELDVVDLSSDETLVADKCKYTSQEMDEDNLADLERSAAQVQWTPEDGGEPTFHYCYLCRSEFSDGLQATADERTDISLFTPAGIIQSTSSTAKKP